MHELAIVKYRGMLAVDSREIAKAANKPHNDLMKCIRQYCGFLNAGGITVADFFIPSTYTDKKGQARACFLATRKGCEMIANRIASEKGALLTAAYINAFNETEQPPTPAPVVEPDNDYSLEETTVNVNSMTLTPVEYQSQRILSTAQLAEAYGTEPKIVSNNFNNNRRRYSIGKHYYILEGPELKEFLQSSNLGLQNESKIRVLYLWTERGALLHAKSLNTDNAWAMYDMLVDTYFKVRQEQQLPPTLPELPATDRLSAPDTPDNTSALLALMASQERRINALEQLLSTRGTLSLPAPQQPVEPPRAVTGQAAAVPTMMGIKETAEAIGLPVHMIRALAKSGEITAFMVGKKCLINYEKLIEHLNNGTEPPAPEHTTGVRRIKE